MRTVPERAKKFVSKLSAEGSVVAVAVVSANADLADEAHQVLLTPGIIWPCVKELACAYWLVRQVGQQVLPLFRYLCFARSARIEFFNRERFEGKAEARQMLKEDKYNRVCRCGNKSAEECPFKMCGHVARKTPVLDTAESKK